MDKIKINLEFDNEGLMDEINIFREAFNKLDGYYPVVEAKGGKVIIKGEYKLWTIDISDYICNVFE